MSYMQFGYFWNSWPLLSSATSKVGLRTFIFCLFWSRKKGSRDFGVSIWTLHICTYHQNLWGVSARVNSYVELFTTHSFTMHCIFILMTWRDAYKIAWLWLWVISFRNCTNDIYLRKLKNFWFFFFDTEECRNDKSWARFKIK